MARRVRRNPVSNTTLYWIAGGAGALGVVGLIWYFTRPKTTTDNKDQQQGSTGNGTNANQNTGTFKAATDSHVLYQQPEQPKKLTAATQIVVQAGK